MCTSSPVGFTRAPVGFTKAPVGFTRPPVGWRSSTVGSTRPWLAELVARSRHQRCARGKPWWNSRASGRADRNFGPRLRGGRTVGAKTPPLTPRWGSGSGASAGHFSQGPLAVREVLVALGQHLGPRQTFARPRCRQQPAAKDGPR